ADVGTRRRYPCSGSDPVRTADGPTAVLGGNGGGDRPAGDLPGPGPAVAAQRQGPPRPGDHLPQVPAQGPAPPLRRRRGAGGGPSPLPGWGGDRGAIEGPAGAAGQASPSPPSAVGGRGQYPPGHGVGRRRALADLRASGG